MTDSLTAATSTTDAVADAGAALDRIEAVVRARRSTLRVDAQREVPMVLVHRLCALGTWAPNHKRTEPWRFVAFTGAGRNRLGEAFEASQRADGVTDDAKLAKARTKYGRAPVVLAVVAAGDDSPVRRDENRDAVSAAIQNLLLGATAAGLASLWSTGGATTAPAVRALCGCAPADQIVGLVYLGWPLDGEVAVPERAPAVVHVIDA
jgi:nitroreductase